MSNAVGGWDDEEGAVEVSSRFIFVGSCEDMMGGGMSSCGFISGARSAMKASRGSGSSVGGWAADLVASTEKKIDGCTLIIIIVDRETTCKDYKEAILLYAGWYIYITRANSSIIVDL